MARLRERDGGIQFSLRLTPKGGRDAVDGWTVGGDGKKGLIDGNAGQVLTQLWGSLVCIAWCAVATFVILKIVDALVGLRVTNEEEVEGLDINLHGETVH